MRQEKMKRGFKLPHVYIILMFMMLLVVILSWIIPSGAYERVLDSDTGREIINPDNFSYVEQSNPITFMNFFEAIYNGFVSGASIMGTLFISSGIIYILEVSGAFGAGIQKILKHTKGKEFSVVVIFYTIFVVFGVLGYGEAAYPFYPLAVTIGLALGYDRVVGAGLAIVGSTVGFTCGMLNMFTTGVAQQLVGLPMFSGMGMRAVGLVVFYIIGFFGLFFYCKKIKKTPEKSIVRDEYLTQKAEDFQENDQKMTLPRVLGLIAFLVVIIIQGIGAVGFGWSFPQIAALYVIFGFVLAVIFRIGPSRVCTIFTQGATRVFSAAFAIGLANAVVALMNQAQILDTLVYHMSGFLNGKSAIVTLLIIYVFVTLFNFFVVSGSGKAVIVMPILQPLGNILHINQQVLVLAYQYGDGITNSFWPGSAMVGLSMCNLGYGEWIRFCWKIYVSMMVAAFVLVIIANAIGYGPF
ncbi:putative ion transporter superfamily protein YfcC [Catenibacillus scindens]|uniref:Putative ion transporter superfamily protein YfcC n=1 Tax=Catenibacillus scindens TaxID=673271 RepID=A0A7W8M478_9FIRM|nr:AbgT family transporter [Catenibacillus scindens]MBB5263006.1 putative ion transporter superfamily protein YfcC [Catenibacillus scindens]